MKQAMISELKARLSKYVALVRRGETIIVRDRNTPVAKLVPYEDERESLQLERPSLSLEELSGITPVKLLKPIDLVRSLRQDRDHR